MTEPTLDHFTSDDRRTLTELNVKFDMLSKMIETKLGDTGSVEAKFAKLDGRVQEIEKFRWWILGAAAVAGFMSHFLGKGLGL
jgi:hypothetical protein